MLKDNYIKHFSLVSIAVTNKNINADIQWTLKAIRKIWVILNFSNFFVVTTTMNLLRFRVTQKAWQLPFFFYNIYVSRNTFPIIGAYYIMNTKQTNKTFSTYI